MSVIDCEIVEVLKWDKERSLVLARFADDSEDWVPGTVPQAALNAFLAKQESTAPAAAAAAALPDGHVLAPGEFAIEALRDRKEAAGDRLYFVKWLGMFSVRTLR